MIQPTNVTIPGPDYFACFRLPQNYSRYLVNKTMADIFVIYKVCMKHFNLLIVQLAQ